MPDQKFDNFFIITALRTFSILPKVFQLIMLSLAQRRIYNIHSMHCQAHFGQKFCTAKNGGNFEISFNTVIDIIAN